MNAIQLPFKPLQVGWPDLKAHEQNMFDAVGRVEVALESEVDKAREYLAVLIIAWHIEQYNRKQPDMPYWEWVLADNPMNSVIFPWLFHDSKKREELVKRTSILFLKPSYNGTWVAEWDAEDIAERMSRHFQSLARVEEQPAFAELEAITLQDKPTGNIYIKKIGVESSAEVSARVGGYFD